MWSSVSDRRDKDMRFLLPVCEFPDEKSEGNSEIEEPAALLGIVHKIPFDLDRLAVMEQHKTQIAPDLTSNQRSTPTVI